ncbi:MAG: caprolactamase subunit beta [Thermoleophilia bacterium]
MAVAGKVDPITLAVVRGVLESTQREMTVTIEKTARSSVFNIAHDYSNTIFDSKPEMVLQGQDIPIHLGSLMPAMRTVAGYFAGEIYPGDVMYHNDPAWGGSHIVDCCMYKPVFYRGELVFWTVSKGHVTDIGGPVPAGYNPDAKESYAEGLRIPPIKIWEKGKERRDIVNFILTNIRSRRDQAGDMRAQLGACRIGERNLINLLDRYGQETVFACIEELLGMAERRMRQVIGEIPDGVYYGSASVEDAGHGYGELEIKATVTITGDSMHVELASPPQIPYFINSYAANSLSGVYLGIMMFAQIEPPYNEGLYRAITVDVGPPGTLTNAMEPAPSVNATTTPSETITDAVRKALEQAMPEKAVASWGHSNGLNIAGFDKRKGEDYVSMILATIISGGGATNMMDGWPACGPECCFGALTSGDVEIMEYSYPIIIHKYGLLADSGGAGKHRGGSGTVWEVEPIDHEMTAVTFGEGRKYPAPSAAGAKSRLLDAKVGKTIRHGTEGTEVIRKNIITTILPGERIANLNPGGGGVGDPFERDIELVRRDVRDGLVSVEGAREEYGVVIAAATLEIDTAATLSLRKGA